MKWQKWIKTKLIRRKMNSGVRFLLMVHKLQEEMKWPSWRKTQFWRDLEKSPRSRAELFKSVLGLLDEDKAQGGKA